MGCVPTFRGNTVHAQVFVLANASSQPPLDPKKFQLTSIFLRLTNWHESWVLAMIKGLLFALLGPLDNVSTSLETAGFRILYYNAGASNRIDLRPQRANPSRCLPVRLRATYSVPTLPTLPQEDNQYKDGAYCADCADEINESALLALAYGLLEHPSAKGRRVFIWNCVGSLLVLPSR